MGFMYIKFVIIFFNIYKKEYIEFKDNIKVIYFVFYVWKFGVFLFNLKIYYKKNLIVKGELENV